MKPAICTYAIGSQNWECFALQTPVLRFAQWKTVERVSRKANEEWRGASIVSFFSIRVLNSKPAHFTKPELVERLASTKRTLFLPNTKSIQDESKNKNNRTNKRRCIPRRSLMLFWLS